MRILDRYVLRALATPLLYCHLAFILVYVIYDLFQHLDNFVEAGTPLRLAVVYYVFLLPSVIWIIAPTSFLLATLYCLSHLTKSQEITAMRACGVSIYRAVRPIALCGLAGSLAVAAVYEGLGPASAEWTRQFLRQERSPDEDVWVMTNVRYLNEWDDRVWEVEKLDTRSLELRQVRLVQIRDARSDVWRMRAVRAEWRDGLWVFHDGERIPVDEQNAAIRAEAERFETLEIDDLSETPHDILRASRDPEWLSSRDLYLYIRSRHHPSRRELADHWVTFHHRLAIPWSVLIVTLIGIPFGVQTGRKGALTGVLLCLGLFFAFFTLINFGLALGKGGQIPPFLAGWLPNLVFATVAGFMLHRMR